MPDQYYTREPQSASKPIPCAFSYRGHTLRFTTDAGVFSKGELDPGSRLLLDALPEQLSGDVLDMGSGWGAIGVTLAKTFPEARVTMADVNLRALGLCQENLQANGCSATCLESDGFAALADRQFDAVITNPPIRAGKQVIYKMFADAAAALRPEGALYLVIRKQQGAESCEKYLKTLFADVQRIARESGYWVLQATSPLPQGEES